MLCVYVEEASGHILRAGLPIQLHRKINNNISLNSGYLTNFSEVKFTTSGNAYFTKQLKLSAMEQVLVRVMKRRNKTLTRDVLIQKQNAGDPVTQISQLADTDRLSNHRIFCYLII